MPGPGLICPCWIRAGEAGFVTSTSYQNTRERRPLLSETPGEFAATRCVTPPTVRRAEKYIRVPRPVRPKSGLGCLRYGVTLRLLKVNVGDAENGLSSRTTVIWLPGALLTAPGVSTNHIGPPGA